MTIQVNFVLNLTQITILKLFPVNYLPSQVFLAASFDSQLLRYSSKGFQETSQLFKIENN